MEETYKNIGMINMKKEDGEVVSKWDMIQVGEDSESSDSSMVSSSWLSTDSEVEADASSSSSSLSSANGPLFHLTDLMNQLPMRRGLSKHYKGKSQSFTSLAHVKNLEDLAKKVSPYGTALISSYDRRRMKSCKSYAVFAEATITYKRDTCWNATETRENKEFLHYDFLTDLDQIPPYHTF